MPRENNFLIGHGERLTQPVTINRGGGVKELPYDFPTAKQRLATTLGTVRSALQALPDRACPREEAVAVLTMHPRFVSKSDFPQSLLREAGLRAIGSKQRQITPERWGIQEPPGEAITEDYFVAGTRAAFYRWAESIGALSNPASVEARQLSTIETIASVPAEAKIKSLSDVAPVVLLEVVIHNDGRPHIVESFIEYVRALGGRVWMDRLRDVDTLTFIPVEVRRASVIAIAQFSFLRVMRGMPQLRPLFPSVTRHVADISVRLPTRGPIDNESLCVVFDGGLPASVRRALSPWVTLIEPDGIGPAVPEYESHGLGVTGAFLFGPLSTKAPPQPICKVEHVRVLDRTDANVPSLEYVDVVDRITRHLDATNGRYQFIGISLGPDIPVSDDEVSYWTAALDQRFARTAAIAAVAAGNSGNLDAASGLNRIQPPSDAVNALAVGAAEISESAWSRASYSAVGPGRNPGLVKPDGLAFGGSPSARFFILSSPSRATGTSGTSFATPFALRSAASIKAQLGDVLSSLTMRALMIHRAEDGGKVRAEVGWGLFETDPNRLITCLDDEPVVIYQGTLPADNELRAWLAIPSTGLAGHVTITATLLISPEVNPAFVGSYTQSGFQAVFRPHIERFTRYQDGSYSVHPTSKPFFSESSMYGAGEYELVGGGLKWEPCVKRERSFLSSSLLRPCFDIYNHRRDEGAAPIANQAIVYALIVSIKAPRVPDLYARVVRAYQNILVPIRPAARIRVSARS